MGVTRERTGRGRRRASTGRRRGTRLRTAAAAGALALALAGCDGGSENPAAESPRASEEAAETEAAPKTTPVPASLEELSTELAAVQVEAGSVRMETSFGGAFAAAGLGDSVQTLDATFGPAGSMGAMHLTQDVAGQPLEMLIVDEVLYVSLAVEAPGMWMSLTREEAAASSAFAPFLATVDGTDPATAAQRLKEAVTDFTHTTSDGVDTYTATIDPSKIDPKLAGITGAENLASVDAITARYDVSQADGLPIQALTTVTAMGQEGTITMKFSQWGEVGAITAPAAENVVSFSEVEAGMAPETAGQ